MWARKPRRKSEAENRMKKAIKIYKNFTLMLLALMFFTTPIAAFVPLWGHYIERFGRHDLKLIGIAVFLNYSAAALFSFIFSMFEDKGGKYFHYVFASLVVSTLAWLGFKYVDSIYSLYLIIIVLGIGTGMILPSFDVVFQNTILKDRRALSWGLFEGLQSLSYGLGALIGSHVVYYFNYDILFYTLAALNVIALILMCILFKIEFPKGKIFSIR